MACFDRAAPGCSGLIWTTSDYGLIVCAACSGSDTLIRLTEELASMLAVISDPVLTTFRALVERRFPLDLDVRWVDPEDDRALGQAIVDADVLISSRCTAEVAGHAKRLLLVQTFSSGVDMVDLDALPAGAILANTYHHEDSIAEYLLATAIQLRRDFIAQDRALREGIWRSPLRRTTQPWRHSLANATIGFIGFGHIGMRAWRAFHSFGSRGIAVTRTGRVHPTSGLAWAAGLDRLPDLLGQSDVVILSAPLTPESTDMIGSDEFAMMKSSAVLINVGRGPLVNETALYEALRDRAIGAAAIDVWYHYPAHGDVAEPSSYPLADLDNVVMTPHVSGVTVETFEARIDDVADNLERLTRNQPLKNVVATAR